MEVWGEGNGKMYKMGTGRFQFGSPHLTGWVWVCAIGGMNENMTMGDQNLGFEVATMKEDVKVCHVWEEKRVGWLREMRRERNEWREERFKKKNYYHVSK